MPDEFIKSEGNDELIRALEQNIPPQDRILNQYDIKEVSPTGLITQVKGRLSIPENQNLLVIDPKGTVEKVPPIEPKQSEVSSQNEVDLENFKESIYPPTETLSKQPPGSTVPSFIVATEKKQQPTPEPIPPTPEPTPPTPEPTPPTPEPTPPTPEPTPPTPEPTPPTPEPTPEPTEEDRLAELNKTLEEINNTLKNTDLNIQTLLQQGIENFSREQMIEYIGLIQKQSELITKTYEIQQEKNRIAFENAIKMLQGTEPTPPTPEPTPPTPEPTPPTPEPTPPTPEPTPPTPEPTPITVSDTDRIKELEDQLRQLRGENTPEQQSAALGRELSVLEEKFVSAGLTDAEKIRYFDILKAKENIDKQINQVEQENKRKRERKEKIIKIAAGIIGAGVALTTPALGVAAVIGITFGGRTLGRVMQRQSEKLRSQSNSIKYESRRGKTLKELEEMDRKQKRKEFWANRLGEASAVLIGGSTGYAIGTLFEGIVGEDFYIGEGKPPETPVSTNTTSSTNTTASASESGSFGGNTQSAQASAPNSTMPDATTFGTGSQNWLTGETFNASELGWDYNEMGWLGDRVHLTELGGQNGIMQGEFFQELSRLVPREKLVGQASGNIVNQFLRQAYGGLDPAVAAQKAAEILLGS